MKAPAEAAWAPGGDTYTTTGNGDANMSSTIWRVESSRPPGVFNWTISRRAPAECASSIALERRLDSSGVIASSTTSRYASPLDASAMVND